MSIIVTRQVPALQSCKRFTAGVEKACMNTNTNVVFFSFWYKCWCRDLSCCTDPFAKFCFSTNLRKSRFNAQLVKQLGDTNFSPHSSWLPCGLSACVTEVSFIRCDIGTTVCHRSKLAVMWSCVKTSVCICLQFPVFLEGFFSPQRVSAVNVCRSCCCEPTRNLKLYV